jgi:hypothetical protein
VKARKPAPEPASAERLIEVLGDELYAAPSWALFREVRSIIRAGVSDTRLADAVAVHMTPGPWRLHRIEVKRSRKDWVVELNDPGKAEAIARYVILSCRHRALRPLDKKPPPRIACWDCAEERAASGPGLARAVPAPAVEEVSHVG